MQSNLREKSNLRCCFKKSFCLLKSALVADNLRLSFYKGDIIVPSTGLDWSSRDADWLPLPSQLYLSSAWCPVHLEGSEDKGRINEGQKTQRTQEVVETTVLSRLQVLTTDIILYYELLSFGGQFSATMTRSSEFWESPLGGGAPCHLLRALQSCV